ncbi:MAG: acyltransferase [Bacillota bacterium]
MGKFIRKVKIGLVKTLARYTPFKYFMRVEDTNNSFGFMVFFMQKILGFNRKVYWPAHFTSTITNYKNILCGIDGAPGLSPGCYIQGKGKIIFGDYVIIGPNVGIISANHNIYDIRDHGSSSVIIGSYCWIGMNAVILPGVELGPHTVVAAGSVVTKSFPRGYCVLAGNPAKIVKEIEERKCINFEYKRKFYGYIPAEKFEKYRRKHLSV